MKKQHVTHPEVSVWSKGNPEAVLAPPGGWEGAAHFFSRYIYPVDIILGSDRHNSVYVSGSVALR